jgi:hypothetical protein
MFERDKLPGSQQKILQSSNVLIATPAYNDVFYEPYVRSLFNTQRIANQIGMKLVLGVLGGGFYIEPARNVLAQIFLESDCTHLFFIDADIGWKPENFFDLILSEKQMIGATYPKKTLPITYCHHPKDPISDLEEPTEVNALPAGFLCIRRDALNQFKLRYPERTCFNENGFDYEFFTGELRNGKRQGEDIWFSHDMSGAGITPYLAPWIKPTHIGNHRFQSE